MPYDSTLPADHAPVVAAELRGQLNALKDLITDQAAQITALQNQCTDLNNQIQTFPSGAEIASDTSGATLPVNHLNLTVSNPPTQTEMQAIADKLDEMLAYLHRE